MSHAYRPGPRSLVPDTVELYAACTFGGATDPTLTSRKYPGIVSISRESTGQFKATLNSKYQDVVEIELLQGAAADASCNIDKCVEDTSNTALTASTPSITFWTNASSTTAADPASGSTGVFKFKVVRATDWTR